MAIPNDDAVTQLISDAPYKVKTLTTFKGQPENVKIIDPSHYDGFVNDDESWLDLAEITWSVWDGTTMTTNEERFVELRWKNFNFVVLRLMGNGSYGNTIGLPVIWNNVVDGSGSEAPWVDGNNAGRVRLNQNNNDTNGFLVCVWNKAGNWTSARP